MNCNLLLPTRHLPVRNGACNVLSSRAVIMRPMRETWTDERLDDLNERVADMGRRMDDGFNRVDAKIDALHHLMLQIGAGIFATFAVGVVGVIASQL